MRWLPASISIILAGCSTVEHQAIKGERDARLRPLMGGSATDMKTASLVARKCGIQGARVGTFNGGPALYIDPARITFSNTDCLLTSLRSAGHSEQLGFFGSEDAAPKR